MVDAYTTEPFSVAACADELLLALPDPAAVFGFQGAVLVANAGWWQHGRQEPLAVAASTAARTVLAGGRREHLEDVSPAGLRMHWRVRAVPLSWRGTRAALVTCRDVSAELRAQEEVERLHRRLERRVARRTRQLEAANRELEAFSNSVSHDLKAPLAAIDGFTWALLERGQGRLDERDLGYLRRVRACVEHMYELVDAMLSLTQLTRDTRLARRDTDLSALAHEVLAELRAQEPGRCCVARVEPGIRAMCDPTLMAVVLRNLLGNAWKFSARKPVTWIEFAVEAVAPDGTLTLRVRDRGAGFDGAQADKVFAPFQRLHHRDEFPGTGIGLATVQRIVHRHGGTVRAAGVPGEGATFWVTLPQPAGWPDTETLDD